MYYIYEMHIPEDDLQMLKAIAAKDRISVNDLFVQGFAYIATHPDEVKAWKEWYDRQSEEERKRLNKSSIIRIYPVEDGETEEEARRRQIQREWDAFPYLDGSSALPIITQPEFCDHVEDEDFFLRYGNPVVIKSDSGTKLLAIAFPMYERYMEICGRKDEVEVIKRECAEAYERSKT